MGYVDRRPVLLYNREEVERWITSPQVRAKLSITHVDEAAARYALDSGYRNVHPTDDPIGLAMSNDPADGACATHGDYQRIAGRAAMLVYETHPGMIPG